MTSKESFKRASDIASCLIAIYEKWISVPAFREAYDSCFFSSNTQERMSDRIRAIPFVVDLCKNNLNLGYTVRVLDNASMPAYYVVQHLMVEKKWYDYETFLLCTQNDEASYELLGIFEIVEKEAKKVPTTIIFYELLNTMDENEGRKYMETLKYYTRYVGQEAKIEACAVVHWLKQLEIMSVGVEKALEEPIKVEYNEDDRNDEQQKPMSSMKQNQSEESDLYTVLIGIDFIVSIGIIILLCGCNIPGMGFIVGSIWFVFWLIPILLAKHDDNSSSSYSKYYTPGNSMSYHSYDSEQESFESGQNWLKGFDMTKDYYGKHGEFDLNDESRRASEDIQQMHNCDSAIDLHDHYYWDDVLDAETDGYLDD